MQERAVGSAGDAAEDHRHPFSGRRGAGVGQEAGEAGAARRRSPGCRSVGPGRGPRRSATRAPRVAARPSVASTSNTPSQSYVSSSRMPSAAESGGIVPRGHQLAPVRPEVVGVDASLGGPTPRPLQRRASLGLHGVETDGGAEPQPVHVANAPPPTWTTTRSTSTSASASSQPIVRPPSRHRALSGPWTPNGIAPSAHRLAEAQHRRIARRVARPPRAAADVAPSEPSSRARRRRPSRGRTPRAAIASRWASVAAAIAALPHEAMASGRRDRPASPSASAARRWSSAPARWRPLWLPPTLPVSSFTQTSASSRSDSTAGVGQRRRREAGGDLAGQGDARRLRSSRWPGRTPTRRRRGP